MEGAGWHAQPSKKTSTGLLRQIHDADLTEGNSGDKQKCFEGNTSMPEVPGAVVPHAGIL